MRETSLWSAALQRRLGQSEVRALQRGFGRYGVRALQRRVGGLMLLCAALRAGERGSELPHSRHW